MRIIAAALIAAFALAACGNDRPQQFAEATSAPAAPVLRVESLTVTPTVDARTPSSAFFTVRNVGGEADRLVSATTTAADRIDIHDTRVDDKGEARSFSIAGGVPIPADGQVAFAPGGLHLKVIGAHAPLGEGGRIPLTLTFERSGAIQFEAVVAPAPGG